jgi:protein-arginine deiminase
MFQGIDLQGQALKANFYKWLTPDAVLADSNFVNLQTTLQRKLFDIVAILTTSLGLTASEVIWLPVLFRAYPPRPTLNVAYGPNVVNMLVVTRANGTAVLCVPKPFGPVVSGQCKFEELITNRLVAAGVKKDDIKYIDDFIPYHEEVGEIHCGTNSLRRPRKDVWWWEWEDK